jgi:hypothetical protein
VQVTTRGFIFDLIQFRPRFQARHRLDAKKSRRRLFSPQKLFFTVLELVGSTNSEGYLHALAATFLDLNSKKRSSMPGKSALSQIRQKISYHFFSEQFEDLMRRFEPHRLTWEGLRVYAIDGHEVSLPCSEDVLKAGYRGRALYRNKETHYPRMYLVQTFDVLSGVTKDLFFSPFRNELDGMRAMVKRLERNSLCLYDRFYMSKSLLDTHRAAGNYFLARVKKNSFLEIREFLKASGKKIRRVRIHGVRITLIKHWVPGKSEPILLATNLPKSRVIKDKMYKIYSYRWEIENAFRDLNSTLKLPQWHSTKTNGILQELYCIHWLLNVTRIEVVLRQPKPKSIFDAEYQKPNCKLLISMLRKITISRRNESQEIAFITLLHKSTEKRTRLSRASPREIKFSENPFQRANAVKRRAA